MLLAEPTGKVGVNVGHPVLWRGRAAHRLGAKGDRPEGVGAEHGLVIVRVDWEGVRGLDGHCGRCLAHGRVGAVAAEDGRHLERKTRSKVIMSLAWLNKLVAAIFPWLKDGLTTKYCCVYVANFLLKRAQKHEVTNCMIKKTVATEVGLPSNYWTSAT